MTLDTLDMMNANLDCLDNLYAVLGEDKIPPKSIYSYDEEYYDELFGEELAPSEFLAEEYYPVQLRNRIFYKYSDAQLVDLVESVCRSFGHFPEKAWREITKVMYGNKLHNGARKYLVNLCVEFMTPSEKIPC